MRRAKGKKPIIAIVLGTRPEIIKCAPIIRECARRKIPCRVVHTGQHYSPEMDAFFFDELALPAPAYRLTVGSLAHGAQTGRMLERIEDVFQKERPDFVLVQGDTNSGLSGALAASKLRIPVGHIEAGLRSYFREMPEETNRILIDHLADFLFVPTRAARDIARGEGIPARRIFLTGNPIVDAVLSEVKRARSRSSILSKLGLSSRSHMVLTAHRPETVDKKDRLSDLLDSLAAVLRAHSLPIVWPIHPRTNARLAEFDLRKRAEGISGLRIIDPLGFWDFLALQSSARLVLTDSGGIQEESCILGVPCVTLRDSTERPETVEVGGNILAGTSPQRVARATRSMMGSDRAWKNPFGQGDAAQKIVDILIRSHADER